MFATCFELPSDVSTMTLPVSTEKSLISVYSNTKVAWVTMKPWYRQAIARMNFEIYAFIYIWFGLLDVLNREIQQLSVHNDISRLVEK